MYTKKQVRDLPIGFHPVISTRRGSRYNSSTQQKSDQRTVQVIEENKEKLRSKRKVTHFVTAPEQKQRNLMPFKGFKPRKPKDRRKKDGSKYIIPKVVNPNKLEKE